MAPGGKPAFSAASANTAAMALYASAGGNTPSDQVMIEFDLDESGKGSHEAQ